MPRRIRCREGWSPTVPPSGTLRRGTGFGMIVVLATLCLAVPSGAPTITLARDRDVAVTSSTTNDGWQSYRSEHGHFSVEHPAGWTAEERIDARGDLVTTLAPRTGGGISVIVRPGSSVQEGAPDFGNVHCHPVVLDGRAASTCLDTVSSSLFTTIVGAGKTYIITGNRRRGDRSTYDRIVASFRILP